MNYTAEERHARDEIAALDASLRPLFTKMGKGERLSVDELRTMDRKNERLAELRAEVRGFEHARKLSEVAALSVPDADSSKPDASAEGRAFTEWLRTGRDVAGMGQRISYQDAQELRAAGETTNSAGGYLVPPGWWQRLQIALKAYGGVAADFQLLATDSGQPMQWATTDPTAVVGSLISENTQVSDVDYTFGQGTLSAYMFTSGVQKVSFQLANDAAFNIDAFITNRVAEALGRAEASYALTGSGASQPLGIITALNTKGNAGTVGASVSPVGGYVTLGTAQKIQQLSYTPGTAGTDSSLTELQSNALAPSTVLSMIKAVDPAYRALGAKFYLNDAQLAGMRSLLDGFGRPFWPSLWDASPSLVGYPVVIDNNIANLTASTTGGPIFGHLQSAMVQRRVSNSGLLRLKERYADYLQIGFIGFERIDFRSNDLRAAVTVKPAAT